MAIMNVQATATLKENVRVEVEARGHQVVIDEPEALGGTDQGMNPVELLLSALGACQAIVARTYAKKFDIDLKSFRVDLEGELDIDGFLAKSDVRAGFQNITTVFYIETDAAEEKVQAFKEFLEAHCPVGDSIANPVELAAAKVVIGSPAEMN